MIYQNFDLEIISPQGADRLCARVLESPQGDCPFVDVKWPFDVDEENELLGEIYGGLRQRRGRGAQANSIQDFGGKLFEAVFAGDIEHLFRSSLDTAFNAGKGLRVRLRLPEDSELHMRPWEFLFDTESRQFLAVREHTPLVRYLPVAKPIAPITVEGPLRVLVALSSPTDHPRLDIAREWEILCNALEPSISAGHLELRRVPGRCTFDNLRDSLRHFGAHIFHFVGHGIPGALVLEQESGKGLEMEATHLRAVFPSGALPRLVVLNACSGAITQDVPFSGLAQGFLRQGVPAVVAMQASITDDAALIFTRYFYRDLVEIGAVDASLTEARLRMQGNGHPIEWGTPVLYMRALNGQLFQPTHNETADLAERHLAAVKASAFQERVEPTLNERKRIKEPQAKPEAPPPPVAASAGEKKKPRTARTRESTAQTKPGRDMDERHAMPKVQEPASGLAPKPEPDRARQDPGSMPPPGEYTPPGRPDAAPVSPGSAPHVQVETPPPRPPAPAPAPSPAPGPAAAAQDIPPRIQTVEPMPPRMPEPEPKPAARQLPPAPQAVEVPPPPVPETKPAEAGPPPKAQPVEPTSPPRPAPVGKPGAPRITAKVVAPPSPPETPEPPAGPATTPRAHARRRTTAPPRLEPVLDQGRSAQDAQAGEPLPPFIPEPVQEETPEIRPAQPPRSKRTLVLGAACLLGAGVVAAGMKLLLPGESAPTGMPAPAPSTAGTTPPSTAARTPAPSTIPVTPAPAARPDSTPPGAQGSAAATPSPAMANDKSARRAPEPADQARPASDVQPTTPAAKPRPGTSASRKTQAAKPAPSRPADECKNVEVSERSADCLFQ